MDLTWTAAQMQEAQRIVVERFAMNSVAGHLAPQLTVDGTETTVKRNRFDVSTGRVVDRETLDLYEPFSFCFLTKAQVDEFASSTSNGTGQTKAVTSLTRAASRLARWHDVLFFAGFSESAKPVGVEMPPLTNLPQSLRGAALEAEETSKSAPIPVNAPFNERLVDAVYQAVLRLETRGYYTAYHLVLGEMLWRALHEPTRGSLVLPRERIKPTLIGDGEFHRTTTLPPNEALLVSKDGPTFDCVIAGDAAKQPYFEFLRVAPDNSEREELYLFRIRERFTPRVRESQAIVRLVADGDASPDRAKTK
jgi:uncharacterized linocin/CFP29 family protein